MRQRVQARASRDADEEARRRARGVSQSRVALLRQGRLHAGLWQRDLARIQPAPAPRHASLARGARGRRRRRHLRRRGLRFYAALMGAD